MAEIFFKHEKPHLKKKKKKNTKKTPRIRKNQNFENRAWSCFKLAQSRRRGSIS